jgi:Glycine zipper
MRRIVLSLFLLGLAMTIPLTDALAQSAVGGAIVGGAIGGRRGAAIGAATGAVVGSHRRHWHGHYYWRHGSCWVRTSNGRSHQVSHRYCR